MIAKSSGVTVKNAFKLQAITWIVLLGLETAYRTQYEKYVCANIDAEKQHLDNLYNEFAKANSLNKQVLKRKIDDTIQNIELLQKELEKYGAGLSWLREPSKERDEKAEHLEKIQEEKPAAPPPTPAVGTPRPSVGTPVGARPQVGTQVGTPRPQVGAPVGSKPQVGTPVAKPQVGTTQVGTRPQVGTPIGTRPQIGTPVKPVEKPKKDEEESSDS
jgi:hypothetical protein